MSASVISKEPNSFFEFNDLLFHSYFIVETRQHSTILLLIVPIECLTPLDPVQIYLHFISYNY